MMGYGSVAPSRDDIGFALRDFDRKPVTRALKASKLRLADGYMQLSIPPKPFPRHP